MVRLPLISVGVSGNSPLAPTWNVFLKRLAFHYLADVVVIDLTFITLIVGITQQPG